MKKRTPKRLSKTRKVSVYTIARQLGCETHTSVATERLDRRSGNEARYLPDLKYHEVGSQSDLLMGHPESRPGRLQDISIISTNGKTPLVFAGKTHDSARKRHVLKSERLGDGTVRLTVGTSGGRSQVNWIVSRKATGFPAKDIPLGPRKPGDLPPRPYGGVLPD